MRIILTTETSIAAVSLKSKIIAAIKGEIEDYIIQTWSYTKSGDDYDIVYHNLEQYTETPEKNVLFRVEVDGTELIFSTAWWKTKPEPAKEMLCIHTGRLVEMLLKFFSDEYIKFNIVNF